MGNVRHETPEAVREPENYPENRKSVSLRETLKHEEVNFTSLDFHRNGDDAAQPAPKERKTCSDSGN